MAYLIEYIYIIPAMLIAIVLHELAHALVSYWLGDPTPKEYGRLSLNPFKHLDPLGILCLLFFHVGWAKPVVINPEYYKHRKFGTFLTAIAGPFTNYLISFISAFILAFLFFLVSKNYLNFLNEKVFEIIIKGFMYLMLINIGLGTFNLIPIPPLDGSRVLGSFLSENANRSFMRFQRYGFIVILLLLGTDSLVARMMGTTPLMTVAVEWIRDLFLNIAFRIFGM